MKGVRSSSNTSHDSAATTKTTPTSEARAMALLLRGKICIECEVFYVRRNRLTPFPADRSQMMTSLRSVTNLHSSLKHVSISGDRINGIGSTIFLCTNLEFHFGTIKFSRSLQFSRSPIYHLRSNLSISLFQSMLANGYFPIHGVRSIETKLISNA